MSMNVQQEIARLIADPEAEQRTLELLGIMAEIDRKLNELIILVTTGGNPSLSKLRLDRENDIVDAGR